MNRAMLLSAAVAALVLPGQALAEGTGLRTIANIGCHTEDNTCWADISGAPVGPASCRGTSLRFSTNSANGKNILSLLTSAFLAGKQVNFYVHDSVCYSAQPVFPSIAYLSLY